MGELGAIRRYAELAECAPTYPIWYLLTSILGDEYAHARIWTAMLRRRRCARPGADLPGTPPRRIPGEAASDPPRLRPLQVPRKRRANRTGPGQHLCEIAFHPPAKTSRVKIKPEDALVRQDGPERVRKGPASPRRMPGESAPEGV